jgi:hypothetical protein
MSGWKQYLPLLFLVSRWRFSCTLPSRSGQPEPTNPQSFKDVIAIAKKLDLHFRGTPKTVHLQAARGDIHS